MRLGEQAEFLKANLDEGLRLTKIASLLRRPGVVVASSALISLRRRIRLGR